MSDCVRLRGAKCLGACDSWQARHLVARCPARQNLSASKLARPPDKAKPTSKGEVGKPRSVGHAVDCLCAEGGAGAGDGPLLRGLVGLSSFHR